MEIRPIRNDDDHRAALADIESCWGAIEGTEQGDKLDVLLALVDAYEEKRWPIGHRENFDPVEVLRYAFDELGHTQAELANILGSRSRASEILSRRRALTVDMIHKIARRGKIPPIFRCVRPMTDARPDGAAPGEFDRAAGRRN